MYVFSHIMFFDCRLFQESTGDTFNLLKLVCPIIFYWKFRNWVPLQPTLVSISLGITPGTVIKIRILRWNKKGLNELRLRSKESNSTENGTMI